MNKGALGAIIVTALLVLSISSPIASAVSINYEADSGGDSIYIHENYDIDNTVTVKETTDISFGNLQVDQERTAEGTGEADLEQTITGKTADGTQYTAENDIFIESEETINAKTYTSATGNTLGVAQTVSVTGDAALLLEGEEGGNLAGQSAIVENGRLNSKQILDIGNSVRASLYASIWGDSGAAFSEAKDANGNWANTHVEMVEGELSTIQGAEADGSAIAVQVSNVDAKWGYADSWARDAAGNRAWTVVEMEKGELITVQGAEADGSAIAVQDSYIEGDFAWAACEAENADGRVYVDNFVDGNAVLDFEGVALATDDGVIAGQLSYAEGDFICPWTIAWNQYGNTFIENVVIDGTLYSASGAIANEDVAFSAQYMYATGTYIYRFVEADINAGPSVSNTIELEGGTVTREELSDAFVNWASAGVIVVVP